MSRPAPWIATVLGVIVALWLTPDYPWFVFGAVLVCGLVVFAGHHDPRLRGWIGHPWWDYNQDALVFLTFLLLTSYASLASNADSVQKRRMITLGVRQLIEELEAADSFAVHGTGLTYTPTFGQRVRRLERVDSLAIAWGTKKRQDAFVEDYSQLTKDSGYRTAPYDTNSPGSYEPLFEERRKLLRRMLPHVD